MHKARAFFYVCAGISLLALAYHFGAVSVQAQAGGTIEGGAIQYVPGLPAAFRASGVVGRTFYSLDAYGSRIVQPVPLPGTQHVIATDPAGFNVMLDNGDWLQSNAPDSWRLVGNLLGSPTPATQETWGGVKARYRSGPSAAPQDK